MEKKTDGKMKSVASIPDNYVSILQLQERWMKEKEGKHKGTGLGLKQQQQQVNGQPRREEEEPRVKKSLGGTVHVNPREKEPNCVEKKEAEVSAVVSKKEDGEYSRERTKKWSKKKKKQGGSVKEVVVKCVSKAYIPVKVETPGEKSTAAAASNLIAVDTQFQHLQINKTVEENGRDREVKGPARLNSGQGHYRNQKHETRTMVWVKKGEK